MAVGVRRADQIILHLAVAANLIGFGVALALLADLQDAYGFPMSGLGLIAGSSLAAAFVSFLWLSRYADRGHAKVMMMGALLTGAAALVVTAYAHDLWVFVAARAVLGLAEGVFLPAARRVVLDWNPNRPGEALGRLFAAAAGGFALGPLIGALLAARFGLGVPFLVPAVVLVMAVPMVARLEPLAPLEPVKAGQGFRDLLGTRLVVAGVAIAAVDFVVVGAFDAVWARLLIDRGASTVFVGFSFVLIAAPIVVLAARFGRFADRRSPRLVAVPGFVLMMTAVLGYGWLDIPLVLGGAVLLHGVGSAAVVPAGEALVAAGSPPDMLARGQGLLEAVGFMVAAISAVFAGWAYGALGRGVLWSVIAAAASVSFAVGWWVARPSGSSAAPRPQPPGNTS